MPLSKEEQRTLDEIERALQVDDPKFAAHVSFDRLRYHRVILASIAFLLATLVLIAGVIATQAQFATGVIVSVTGFVAMVAAISWLLRHPIA